MLLLAYGYMGLSFRRETPKQRVGIQVLEVRTKHS
jgi:hypothetical protein